MRPLRRIARPLARWAAAGLPGRVVDRFAGGAPALAVLAYHRVLPERGRDRFSLVVSEARFEEQVRFLVGRYRVLPLDRALEALEKGRLDVRRAVAITFDDGYADVGSRAAPILDRHRAPATLFLSTAGAASGEPYWWDVLESAGELPEETHLRARGLPPDERDRLVTSIAAGRRPGGREDRPMRWAEIRSLPRGFAIGGHGDRHVSLGRAAPEEARRDARACADALAREAPGHVPLFAYPFGAPEDVTEAAVEAVRRAGFAAAFTTEEGVVRRGADRYRLPRVRAFDEGAGSLALRLWRAFSPRGGGL